MTLNGKQMLAWLLAAGGIVTGSLAAAREPARPMTANALGMQFVRIDPGTFQMGCSRGDHECHDEERPAHTVAITRPFEIGRFEVTHKEWNAMRGLPRPDPDTASHPTYVAWENQAVSVTWNEAARFIAWMNDRNDGYRYRFPTEAEWEYAARAGTTFKYGAMPHLPSVTRRHASHGGDFERLGMGGGKPNAWGLYDTLGNAAEWVQDWYDDYGSASQTDPKGPPTGSMKIRRGGGFGSAAGHARVSVRAAAVTSLKTFGTGFRLAREAEGAERK
jgi:formylglycine-generating enzyme required for sulfatase activity